MRAKNTFGVFVIKDTDRNFLFIDIYDIRKVFGIKTELECDQNKWRFLQQVQVAAIKKKLLFYK